MGISLPDYLAAGSRGKFTYSPPTSGDDSMATSGDTSPPGKPTFIEFVDNS